MKIKIQQQCYHKNYNYTNISETLYTQEQYDYIFKYLDFDKLDKNYSIHFYKLEITIWFCKTYISSCFFNDIYKHSLEGYEWLKQNFGKSVFKIRINYSDKQELKTIINKIINIKLIRNKQ